MAARSQENPFSGTNLSTLKAPHAGEYHYKGNQSVYVVFKTSADVLAALVPAPLKPNKEGVLILGLLRAQMVAPEKLTYHEVMLVTPAVYRGKVGDYVIAMYLDKTMPITAGREVWGFPKFDGKIRFSKKGRVMRGSLSRGGKRLASFTYRTKKRVDDPPKPQQPIYMVRMLPRPNDPAAFSLKQLVSTTQQNVKETRRTVGQATLKLGSIPSDPLGKIPVEAVLMATYVEGDMTLGKGKVLYDYLKQKSGTPAK